MAEDPEEVPNSSAGGELPTPGERLYPGERGELQEEVVHRFDAFFGTFRPPSPGHQLFEMLSESQRGELIKNDAASEKRKDDLRLKQVGNQVVFAGMALLGVLLICWLFLAYDASEHIDAVISAFVGLLGGFGLGRASAK